MNWTEWIEQYPKLKEYWQMIPEPANILFRQQIENYAKDYHDTEVKNLGNLSVSRSATVLCGLKNDYCVNIQDKCLSCPFHS